MKKSTSRSLLAGGVLAMILHQAVAGGSNFIEDMPPLEHDADRSGAMIWVKPGVDRSAYTRVMIEPITIFISPDSEYKGLNADDLKALADEFQKVLTTTLEPEVPVVNKAGPGVIYLHAALTNVKLEKKKRGLFGYTPIGLVVTTAQSAAGKNISLKDARLEVEMLDSVSGERLGVLLDKTPVTKGSEELSWDSISETFAYYADRYKRRMHAGK